ncbi:MAG: inner membrane-spanning protein YciB [Halioglobus sp.]|nr:inner membrane-spanning protein YciB [Halioglobus sp.]
MKQLLEFLPIALFFIVYQFDGEQIAIGGWEHQFDGIFSATAVLMGATALQVVIASAITRRLEKRLLLLLLAVLIFGGATLAFRNAAFIYWKPTIFNWIMALVFGASQFIGEKNLMERTLGRQIHVPRMVWTRLNLLWVSYFLVVGGLNLAVAYGFSEEVWVSYKLYSAIGFTLLLTALTALIISPYLKEGGDGEVLQRDE